jgi:PRTRC genetic system protein C
MAIEIKVLKRTFTFNGVTLTDPGAEFTPEEVRDVHSAQFPDISTAIIEGPVHSNDSVEYKFVRNVGTKG